MSIVLPSKSYHSIFLVLVFSLLGNTRTSYAGDSEVRFKSSDLSITASIEEGYDCSEFICEPLHEVYCNLHVTLPIQYLNGKFARYSVVPQINNSFPEGQPRETTQACEKIAQEWQKSLTSMLHYKRITTNCQALGPLECPTGTLEEIIIINSDQFNALDTTQSNSMD